MLLGMTDDFESMYELSDDSSEDTSVPEGSTEPVADPEEQQSGVVYERLPNGQLVPKL